MDAVEDFLTYKDLRDLVANIAEGQTQKDIAEELGVEPSSISKAVNTQGPRYFQLQRRILERYAPGWNLDEQPYFRCVKKPK